MKLLITGGAGFIGSALIRFLSKNKSINIINLDNLTYAGNLESLNEVQEKENYQFYKIDICDLKSVEQVFIKEKPNAVMHLAAESHVDRSIDNPKVFLNTNIIGTFNLLEVSRKYCSSLKGEEKNNFRFLHISTDEVYGSLGKNGSFNEETSYKPNSPYSSTKASSDHLVRAWGNTYDIPILITNCSNNYGEYQYPEKLVPLAILNALEGKAIPVYGSGEQIRDWLYVEDHVNALWEVIKKGRVGETYNIGSNNEKTNLEIVNLICSLLEKLEPNHPKGVKNYQDLITNVADRPGHDFRYSIDSSKINKELGWEPKESFESGLEKTILWYIKHREWCEKVKKGIYSGERLGFRTP